MCTRKARLTAPGRERKKNEALAAQIFGKGKDGRRKSVPLKSTAAGSLASRVGVQKVHPSRISHLMLYALPTS